MTLKQQDQKLLELAIQHTAKFLTLINTRSPDFIVAEVHQNVLTSFRVHHRRLSSLQILEVADYEFQIRANGHAEGTLLIEKKGGKGEA